MLYNVIRVIYHPCLRYRRESGRITRLENNLAITEAVDEKLAAYFIKSYWIYAELS